MKTSLVIKLIIIIAVLAGLGYILYKDYYKTKDFVFEAKIKEVVVNDNVYTILVEEYDKKKKEYVTEYEFELNKDTKIIYDNKETTKDQLKVNQKVTITASNEVMPSEPAKLSNVKKIVISKD
ncbi:putative uncharacterized protein [Mycoplasma sp. CAG:611]|jgi:hypothetical protein|nr:putative uncharacterized protein [Mycoplasma sp. CAG:611]